MNRATIKQYLLYIVGALLLGVLVNAVWEFMARPFVLFVQEIILNLSTLGIQRLKDSMYSEIAKGRYDRASLQMMGLYVSLFVSCLLALPFVFFFALRKLNARFRSIPEIGSATTKTMEERREELAVEIQQVGNSLKVSKRLAIPLTFLTVVVAAGCLTSVMQTAYADSAVANFEQLLSITRPFLTEPRNENIIRSAFSQIRNKSDYEKLIMELKTIAQKQGQHVPDFSIW